MSLTFDDCICSKCGKKFTAWYAATVCDKCCENVVQDKLGIQPARLELPEEKWNDLFDKVEKVILGINDELPPIIKQKAEEVGCYLDKYMDRPGWIVLGAYIFMTNGPIIIYVGQIYQSCNQDEEAMLKSVRNVYLHELAHAVGNLAEYEVKERGL